MTERTFKAALAESMDHTFTDAFGGMRPDQIPETVWDTIAGVDGILGAVDVDPGYWTTASKERLALTAMTTAHLKNAMRYMENMGAKDCAKWKAMAAELETRPDRDA